MRGRQAAHVDHGNARDRGADLFGFVQGAAAQQYRAAGAVREPGQGGDRACLDPRVHDPANHVPRTADHLDRHRAQFDRSDDADRGSAQAIATARRRIAGAAARIAADQRAARTEGAAARRTQRRSRAQEPGNRAGPPRARGEGHGAGADLEVQVGIPGQHVARAAHAAQFDPDPRPAAHRQSGRQPERQAGRIRPHHSRRRHRPAQPDQRHSRSVQDRVRHGDGRCRGGVLLEPGRHGGAAVPPRG